MVNPTKYLPQILGGPLHVIQPHRAWENQIVTVISKNLLEKTTLALVSLFYAVHTTERKKCFRINLKKKSLRQWPILSTLQMFLCNYRNQLSCGKNL
jgi:hypothetical protein